jgi:hypothetical protein
LWAFVLGVEESQSLTHPEDAVGKIKRIKRRSLDLKAEELADAVAKPT